MVARCGPGRQVLAVVAFDFNHRLSGYRVNDAAVVGHQAALLLNRVCVRLRAVLRRWRTSPKVRAGPVLVGLRQRPVDVL